MDDTESRQKEQTRLAYLITLLCLLVFSLIFVENSNRLRAADDQALRQRWSENIGSMLGRLRSHRARNESFFIEYLYRTISRNLICPKETGTCQTLGIYDTPYHSPNGDYFNPGLVSGNMEAAWRILKEAESAAKKLVAMVIENETLTRDVLERVLNESLSKEFLIRIEGEDIDNLVKLVNPAGWVNAPRWYVHGTTSVWGMGRGIRSVGYQVSIDDKEYERRGHLVDVLRLQPDTGAMEQYLIREWEGAFSNYISKATNSQNFALFGSEIRLESLQYIVAIMLAVTGLLVLFATSIRASVLEAVSVSTGINGAYPHFGRFFAAASAGDLTFQRLTSAIWWAFALCPLLLLSVGIVFRYVLFSDIWQRGLPWTRLGTLFVVNTADRFSIACDLVGLTCLAVCWWMILSSESLRRTSKLPVLVWVGSVILGIVLFVALLAAINSILGRVVQGSWPIFAIHIGFAATWTVSLFACAWLGRWVPWCISAAVIAAYASLGFA
jgi:hypothetical protein